MSNNHLDKDTLNAIEKMPIERRQMVAKALGVDYYIPDVKEQITGNGKISMYKRTNSNNNEKVIELPKVLLPNGKMTTAVRLEPECARAYAEEILRVCDLEGL